MADLDKCVNDLLDMYLYAHEVVELTTIEMEKGVQDFFRETEISIESMEESEAFSRMIGDNIAELINITNNLKKCVLNNKVITPLIAGMKHTCIPFNNTLDTLFNKYVKNLKDNYNSNSKRSMESLDILVRAQIIKETAIGAISSYRCKK
ncbi:hypothetical protein LCGC14_0224040 [marine sediment metagenome]|uniref:Uncharacterized protein n=1 Tax=marine sediment metagenome TaxID=412755 RepID=A0A0F9WWS2_9ZZZZ